MAGRRRSDTRCHHDEGDRESCAQLATRRYTARSTGTSVSIFCATSPPSYARSPSARRCQFRAVVRWSSNGTGTSSTPPSLVSDPDPGGARQVEWGARPPSPCSARMRPGTARLDGQGSARHAGEDPLEVYCEPARLVESRCHPDPDPGARGGKAAAFETGRSRGARSAGCSSQRTHTGQGSGRLRRYARDFPTRPEHDDEIDHRGEPRRQRGQRARVVGAGSAPSSLGSPRTTSTDALGRSESGRPAGLCGGGKPW